MMEQNREKMRKKINPARDIKLPWVWDVLLIGILIIGAYLRFTGINWDGPYHLHPDERFLTMVETSLSPVDSLKQYFNTSTSSLNPNNQGYTFYVYGTLPIFIVRYVAEWVGKSGYDTIHLVGRALSGVFDLGTILFVYLIGKRLYKNARLGLVAALFSALAVLQIQLSHYFTVDNFANFFAYAAIYTAICIFTREKDGSTNEPVEKDQKPIPAWLTRQWSSFINYGLFGLLFGMALACKVSIWALALLLPLSAFIAYRRLSDADKQANIPIIIRNLTLAGIVAFIAFRFFQPYAFLGPGFFGIKLNPNWIANLKELSNLSTGDVDVPYALQWAARPITFAFTNIVRWGLGIPLGILTFTGMVWMGWRILKGDWQKHIVIWSWAVFVFVTQSINWVRSMRYQLSIYPALALIASWVIFKLWEYEDKKTRKLASININWRKILAVLAAIITILGTGFWAFAFTSIYTRPVTRVAASEWIYENVPGAINLHLSDTSGTELTQPLVYERSALISAEQPYIYGLQVDQSGYLTSISIEHVIAQQAANGDLSLMVTIRQQSKNNFIYNAAGFLQSTFIPASDNLGDKAVVTFDTPVRLESGKYYQVVIEVSEPGNILRIDGAVSLNFEDAGIKTTKYLPPPVFRLTRDKPYQINFTPRETGTLSGITLNRVVDLIGGEKASKLTAILIPTIDPGNILASVTIEDAFSSSVNSRGSEKKILFDKLVQVDKSTEYILQFTVSGDAELGFYNDAPVVESTWDDSIPLSLNGYNQWGAYDGIYGNVRNLELYWDDTADKLNRFYLTLDQSDAIFISSNRQWGSIGRVPERYPLTIAYYRALLGCPDGKDILWCYSVAQPGMFKSKLGFDLTAVFQSDPALGGIKINDQFAEEAFTVYDHPKVLIFQKTGDYNPAVVRDILGSVDLTQAVHKTPRQVGSFTGNLMLTKSESIVQQSGGTWRDLFPSTSPLNKNPWLAAIAWYLAVTVLGWIVYPLVRNVLKGLPDSGYPFSRLVGILLVAYFTWLVGAMGGEFSRLTIGIVIGSLLLVNILIGYFQRHDIWHEIKEKKKYFLLVEAVFLVFFLIDLGIRIGNPDLWHPWKGGEKPMDLSYFTAVLKSTIFPPYDPWYSGGYINYYYFGFVIVGVLVKFLGIIPDVAYNLILPTLFGFVGIGAFSIGWNLFTKRKENLPPEENEIESTTSNRSGFFSGVAASFLVLLLGNLGTMRMFTQGLQKIVAPDGFIDNARLFQHISWFFTGFGKFLTGATLPYGFGDWYWNPSRAIPGDVITEFPFFTFTYADLHAHMIALPITLLVIAWALSIVLGKWRWGQQSVYLNWLSILGIIAFGGFVIGTLRPTNTWDLPVYFGLASVALFYTAFKYGEVPKNWLKDSMDWVRRFAYSALMVFILLVFTLAYYVPFAQKYGQAYGSIDAWKGGLSPLGYYLVHWGLQLFLIISWFVWETREWLASTPASILKKIKGYLGYIEVVVILFILVLVLLTVIGIQIGWLVGILAVWALLLLLRQNQPDTKRFVLFMIGTGLLLTLFVELFALQGDIGRMNTVFKFYYQAWTLLGISAAAALIWLLPAVTTRWREGTANVWQIVLAILLFSTALYPVTAAADKIRDRMAKETPAGLNGTAFMQDSKYYDQGVDMVLDQDYQVIQWMRDNIHGSPVIVETNTVEYRWGNRYTIYTGLPGVLGWNWHQRQQRGFIDFNGINDRLNEIPMFYQTTDIDTALAFLHKYNVKYIVLGQMERAYYPGDGLLKFEQYNGVFWQEVYRVENTVLYEVMD